MTGLLAGCGGTGLQAPPAPEAQSGSRGSSLRTEVSGLPAGARTALRLSGPDGSSKTIQTGQTLSDLLEGHYRLEGLDFWHGGQIYAPEPIPDLTLQPRQSLAVRVNYRQVRGVQGQISTPTLEAGFVEGQALVKWRGVEAQAGAQPADGGQVELIKMPAGEVGAQRISAASTLEWIDQLRARPDVEYAEPNYWRFPAQTAGDPEQTRNQWAAQQLNLAGAWRPTQASGAVVVAVLDTGLLWRPGDPAATHPDLACGRVLGGYDFVSYPDNGDNDGRDADPYPAPGDDHGTQVAGIIGACRDNGLGIAGVDANARILPVRVLGRLGGTDADIIAGLRWAAGLRVAGAPPNPNPAKVINLSLSGLGVNRLMDEAIREVVRERNVIVVAAAGNDSDQALRYSPAGSETVIAVGATDAQRRKAAFSNFGPAVRVLAPGENIWSPGRNASGAFTYRPLSGTSSAAPFVSGIVALMAAVKPDLTWAEASAYLSRSAVSVPSCAGCGGLVDAGQAVGRAARREALGAFVSPSARVNLGTQASASFTLRNYGDQPARLGVPSAAGLNVSPQSAVLAPGGEQAFTVSLTRAESGQYFRVLELGQTSLLLHYQSGSGVADLGAVQVALCQGRGESGRLIRSGVAVYDGGYRYGVSLEGPGGDLYLRAWVDHNNDGVSEFASGRVYLEAGAAVQNLGLGKLEQRMVEGGCKVSP